jgi:hypothetical protein
MTPLGWTLLVLGLVLAWIIRSGNRSWDREQKRQADAEFHAKYRPDLN